MTALERKKSLQKAKENQLTIVFKLQVTQHEFTFVRKNTETTKVIQRTNKKTFCYKTKLHPLTTPNSASASMLSRTSWGNILIKMRVELRGSRSRFEADAGIKK